MFPCPNCGADALTVADEPKYLCIYCGVVEEEGYVGRPSNSNPYEVEHGGEA